MESAFRINRLHRDKRQAALVFSLALAFLIAYLPVELASVWGGGEGLLTLCARAAAIVACGCALWLLPRIVRPHHLDRLAFCVAAVVVLQRVLTVETFAQNPLPMVAWDIIALFVIYTSLPIAPTYLAALAGLLTASSLWAWGQLHAPQLALPEALSPPLAYLAANVFGFTFALRLSRATRQEFKSLNHEVRMQDELMETLAQLRESLATKDRLFSILGHDLRGPMGSLASLGEYMIARRSELSEAQIFQLLESIRKGSRETYELLDNLLQWSLNETDALQFEPEDVQLTRALEHAVDLYALEAESKDIRLTYQCEHHIVHADLKMLNTILRNLTGNALKHTRRGGTVTLRAKAVGSGEIAISVTDTGSGISPDLQKTIFQLKPSGRSNGSPASSGTGLGLKLCRDFAQRHGGSISLSSVPGEGSCFTVILPAAVPRAQPQLQGHLV